MSDSTRAAFAEVMRAIEDVTPPPPDLQSPVHRTVSNRRVVAVLAFVAVIIVGTVSLTLTRTGTPDEIFTGPPTPTIRPASTETFLGVPIEPGVPFRARVRIGNGPASVVVSYLGPGVFRVEIEAVDIESGPGPLALRTGTGSYVVTEGIGAASFLAAKDLFLRFPTDEGSTLDLGEFGLRHWADRCQEVDHEIVEETTVLSRRALHVRCMEPRGDTEVWVDIETGVVLSVRSAALDASGDLPMADELGIRAGFGDIENIRLGIYAEGGFEVSEFELGIAFGADLFAVSAPGGSEERQVERRVRRIVAGNADCDVDCAEADLAGLADFTLVGSPAPPLTGVLLDGTSFDLATLRGERVALLGWASWCAPSVDLLVAFDQLAKERTDINFIGVLVQEPPADAESLVDRAGISIPTVDASDEQLEDWQIDGCPTTVLVAEDGTVTAGIGGRPAEGLAALFTQAGW
jgi:thiol-disulfide isomerase/thioredoxin